MMTQYTVGTQFAYFSSRQGIAKGFEHSTSALVWREQVELSEAHFFIKTALNSLYFYFKPDLFFCKPIFIRRSLYGLMHHELP
jgi:hypothetical protein